MNIGVILVAVIAVVIVIGMVRDRIKGPKNDLDEKDKDNDNKDNNDDLK